MMSVNGLSGSFTLDLTKVRMGFSSAAVAAGSSTASRHTPGTPQRNDIVLSLILYGERRDGKDTDHRSQTRSPSYAFATEEARTFLSRSPSGCCGRRKICDASGGNGLL